MTLERRDWSAEATAVQCWVWTRPGGYSEQRMVGMHGVIGQWVSDASGDLQGPGRIVTRATWVGKQQ